VVHKTAGFRFVFNTLTIMYQ